MAFSEAGGPTIRFATYSTDSEEPITLDITLEVDEIDGSWNFVYFGYNGETGSVYAAVKGSNSDMKVATASGITHDSSDTLDFQVGSPAGSYTINGYYFNNQINTGDASYFGS